MITLDDLRNGVVRYIDNELMPEFSQNGLEKVVVGTAIGLIIKKNFSKIETFKDHPLVKLTGVMDDEGNIDFDTLAAEVKENMPETGVSIEAPMIGKMTFKNEDVDKLEKYIKKEVNNYGKQRNDDTYDITGYYKEAAGASSG